MQKKRILFVAEAVTLAHVARPMVLAQALDPTHYDVYFACDPRFNDLFSDAAPPQRDIHSISCQRFMHALAKGKPLYDAATLSEYVTEDLELLNQISPDLVVGDFRLSLAISAPLTATPYATISNAYWSPYATRRFPVPELPLTRALGVGAAQALFTATRAAAFALHTIPLNKVRRAHGLPSLGWNLPRLYTWADYTLYADVPELIQTRDLPQTHQYLGPILWSPDIATPQWWSELPVDRPVIYVTLGSSGRSDLLPAIVEALARMPVTAILATAGRFEFERVPDNIFVAPYLPGDQSVKRAKLVICNGGSPTTQQALTHGVPVLGVPSNLDQHLNMEAIQDYGAGRLLRSEHTTSSAVYGLASDLLAQESYATAAARLAQTFSRYNAPEHFARFVARIL